MFVADLDRDETRAFLELAKRMVMADEEYSEEERRMMEEIEAEARMEYNGSMSGRTVEEVCSGIESRASRGKSLLELAALAFVDGKYDARERDLFIEISKAWGVDRFIGLLVEDWGRRRVQLSSEAVDLLQEISVQ